MKSFGRLKASIMFVVKLSGSHIYVKKEIFFSIVFRRTTERVIVLYPRIILNKATIG